MKRLRTGALVAAAVLLVAVTAAACGNDDATSENNASQASIDQLAAQVQQNQMLNSLITIAGLPVHEMDSAAQGGKIDNKYVPTVRMLVRVTALTDWGAELAPQARTLHDDSATLLRALDAGDDVATIKPLSQAAHEAWHTFTEEAWDVVAKSLPPDAGGPRATPEHDSSDNSTPQDATTPAPGGTTTPHADAGH